MELLENNPFMLIKRGGSRSLTKLAGGD